MCIIIVNKGECMYKRVNLYFHDYFYQMLLDKIGKGNISKFIEEKMLIIMNDENKELEDSYKKMGQDKQQMADAISMANACIGDIDNESW